MSLSHASQPPCEKSLVKALNSSLVIVEPRVVCTRAWSLSPAALWSARSLRMPSLKIFGFCELLKSASKIPYASSRTLYIQEPRRNFVAFLDIFFYEGLFVFKNCFCRRLTRVGVMIERLRFYLVLHAPYGLEVHADVYEEVVSVHCFAVNTLGEREELPRLMHRHIVSTTPVVTLCLPGF